MAYHMFSQLSDLIEDWCTLERQKALEKIAIDATPPFSFKPAAETRSNTVDSPKAGWQPATTLDKD